MFSFVILRFPIICSYNSIQVIKLPAVLQAWVFEINNLPSSWGFGTRPSSYMGKSDSGIFHPLSPQARPPACSFLTTERKVSLCLRKGRGLSLGHQPPPLGPLPLSPGLSQCFALICSRKLPLSPCLFPPRFPSSHRNLESRLCPEVRTETGAR